MNDNPNFAIRGEYKTGRVWINEKELLPDHSFKFRNHSPDGFAWGYAGSGPSQLALAILLEIYDQKFAVQAYQAFKFRHIARLPHEDFERMFNYFQLKRELKKLVRDRKY